MATTAHKKIDPSTIDPTISTDRLCVTFDVPPAQRLHVISKLAKAAIQTLGTKNYAHFAQFPMVQYSSGLVGFVKKARVDVMAGPKLPNNRFMRIAFNPNLCSADLVAQFLWETFHIDWDQVLAGTISSMDLALDLHNVDIRDILIHIPRFRTEIVMTTEGRTHYVGGRSSSKKWRIYDKVAQIKARNKKLPEAYRQPVPLIALTRAEVTIRPRVKLGLLDTIQNPFQKLALLPLVYDTPLKWPLRLALDHAQFVGLTGVLQKVPKHRRNALLEAAQSAGAEWWNPEELWKKYLCLAQGLLVPNYIVSDHITLVT